MEIRKLLGIVIILSAFACSEQVELNSVGEIQKPNKTVVKVIGIVQKNGFCLYFLETVVPHKTYPKGSIEDLCGVYKIGDTITVRW